MSAEATRMQDLASEFSKKFLGVIPQIPTAGGTTPSRTHPQPGLWHWPGFGTQILVPLNFSAMVAPLHQLRCHLDAKARFCNLFLAHETFKPNGAAASVKLISLVLASSTDGRKRVVSSAYTRSVS